MVSACGRLAATSPVFDDGEHVGFPPASGGTVTFVVAVPNDGDVPLRRSIPEGMLTYMQRTTVKLPDELDARLRHEAKRRGTTVSELTREAIEAHLGGPRQRRKLLAAGAGASGHDDISERIEEILTREVGSSR